MELSYFASDFLFDLKCSHLEKKATIQHESRL